MRRVPDAFCPRKERCPLVAGTCAEGGVECGRNLRHLARHVEGCPVGKAVACGCLESLQGQRIRQWCTGICEQLFQNVRQRHQRRTGVEDEPVVRDHAELAADLARLFENGNLMSERGKSDGSGESSDTCSDDDDRAHACTGRPFHRSAPRRCPTIESAVRVASARTDTGWSRASGHEWPPVRRAVTTLDATPAR